MSPAKRLLSGRFVVVILYGAVVGCGGEAPPPKLYLVRGKVLVETKLVPEGTVQLRANSAKGNMTWEQPCGTILSDGTFELTTNGQPGAPLGWYKVLVMADNFKVVDPPPSPVWPNYPEGFLPKPLVNPRYLYFSETDVEVEVVEKPPEEGYVLRLKP